MKGSISNAIDDTIMALSHGGAIGIIKALLILQGFEPGKADTIIRWAQQHIERNKDGDTT